MERPDLFFLFFMPFYSGWCRWLQTFQCIRKDQQSQEILLIRALTWGLSSWPIIVIVLHVRRTMAFMILYLGGWICSTNNHSCRYILAPQDITWDTCTESSGRAVSSEWEGKQRSGQCRMTETCNYFLFILWALATVYNLAWSSMVFF